MEINRTQNHDYNYLKRLFAFFKRLISFPYFDMMKFWVRQRLIGFEVPSTPHFDSETTTEWFVEKLKQSERYLEYGTGGSTYLAAKNKLSFICIDSDRFFLNAVKNKIKNDGFLEEEKQIYKYADIGLTGPWGMAVMLFKPSPARIESFKKYSDPPQECQSRTFSPDLILVDGRFRIACALKIIRLLANVDNWTLVVDDYVGRDHYHVIEQYAQLDKFVGRMAVFKRALDFSSENIDESIRYYETILN